MQTTPTLSNAPPAEQAEPAAAVPPTLQAQQLDAQLQALREQSRAQEAQLQALQTQSEQTPLQGWTTDSPLGLALEGLLIGAVAVAAGAACGWALAAARRRGSDAQPAAARARPRSRQRHGAQQDFADSMLYLADQDPAPGTPQTVELHTPAAQRPHRPAPAPSAPPTAHGEEAETLPRRPEQRGAPVAADALLEAVATRSIFGAPVEPSEFDIQAAAGEVERVRNYLAKRRAARAMGMAPHVGDPYADLADQAQADPHAPGHEDTVRMPRPQPGAVQAAQPVADVDIELDFCAALQATPEVNAAPEMSAVSALHAAAPASVAEPAPPPVPAAASAAAAAGADAARPPKPAAPTGSVPVPVQAAPATAATAAGPGPQEAPAHEEPLLELDLSQGASLLADLVAPAPVAPDLDLDALTSGLTLQPAPGAASEPPAPVAPPPEDEAMPELTMGRCVQLELAQEFLELGLVQEARERALEVLQQPQTEFHEAARQLLRQLPLDAPPSTY
ncbi:MAG: hypothetical protein ACT4NV_17500 [Rhodoferax sp.]